MSEISSNDLEEILYLIKKANIFVGGLRSKRDDDGVSFARTAQETLEMAGKLTELLIQKHGRKNEIRLK